MIRTFYILFFLSLYSFSSAQLNKNKEIKIVRGPYLQVASDTSITIRWRTNFLSRSRVRFGTELQNLKNNTDNIDLKTEHIITLTNLKPYTKYYYSIGNLLDTLVYGADYQFTTLPSKSVTGSYRIGLFGDCGALTKDQANVRDAVYKQLGNNYMNAWLLLGDNAYSDGDDDEFQRNFFNPFKDFLKNYPLYTTPGNHDYHDKDFTAKYARQNQSSAYFKIFSMPVNGEAGGIASHNPSYYSFDIGNIHFISLDSYLMEGEKQAYDTTTSQIKWLTKDLEANQNAGWLVVFIHHPPYSKGTHNSDTENLMVGIRENLVKIFERYHVDVVFSGHSHVYERSKPMKSHYGLAATFNPKQYIVDNSNGKNDGSKNSSPYKKKSGGVIYVVTGSAASVSKTKYESEFPHPAMQYSNDVDAGAGLLEVNGNQLDFKWICADGVIRDKFTIQK